MNLLTAEGIRKVYTEREIFESADFSIHAGEKIGVIGINGMGKSTLLKIAAGIETPDGGTVTKGNDVRIRFLPQNPVFKPGITILDAVLEGNTGKEDIWTVTSQAKAILNKLGFTDYDEAMDHLSGGQKKRAALANVLLAPADILILDEPTNHLDNAMAQWLEDYLNNLKSALLMVTHDRYFLDRVSTRIIEIDKGSIYSYPGNYSEYVRLKEARQDMEVATERKRQSILKVELAWLARGARARSTKQKAHIDRIMDLKAQTGPEDEKMVQMSSISTRMGNKTIEVNNIRKCYDGKVYIKDYSYIFLKGERIGIVGPNGCGKSTLLKIIKGIIEPDSGEIDIGQTVKIGYFSQENEYMDERLKVIEYIREIGENVRTKDGVITASQMLERFLFDKTMQWNLIEKLSGGEKRRLYLLSILMSAPNVLILDEPTNDLDIQTLQILEDYLDSFDGIVITVSHDRYFLDRVVRRIFAFEGEGEINQYEGGFSDYLAARNIKNSEKNSTNEDKKKKAANNHSADRRDNKPKKLKFSFKEQREYETIDEEIEELENRIQKLTQEIEESAADYQKLNELLAMKQEEENKLDEKMQRWIFLNDLAEKIEAGKAE